MTNSSKGNIVVVAITGLKKISFEEVRDVLWEHFIKRSPKMYIAELKGLNKTLK